VQHVNAICIAYLVSTFDSTSGGSSQPKFVSVKRLTNFFCVM